MSVPYGSWIGSVIENSFYAPHDLASEIQAFLAEHDALFSRRTANDVAVAFSVASTRDLIAKADASDNTTNLRDESVVVPYRAVTQQLAGATVPFDVVIFADGVTAEDRASAGALAAYSTVVLPDCHALTDRQVGALRSYAEGGGTLVVTDRVDERLAAVAGVRTADRTSLAELLPLGRQVEADVSCAANIHRLDDGRFALHLVNYDYDPAVDAVRPHHDVRLSVELPAKLPRATLVTSDGTRRGLELDHEDGAHVVTVDRLGVHSIVVFHDGELA
jgi:hypothetical protein